MRRQFADYLVFRVLAAISLLGITYCSAWAQIGLKTDIPAPRTETFRDADALLAPWRSSRCALMGREILTKSCVGYLGDEYYRASRVVLYNSDGFVWRTLELNLDSEDYYGRQEIPDLSPFATSSPSGPQSFILRIVRKSSHWHEVEINENTRLTKFALRSDKQWAETPWDGWLYQGVNLYLAEDAEPLREEPDGRVIPGSTDFDRVRFLEAKGDWAFVEGRSPRLSLNPTLVRGWLRWRDGRKILVGCYFNQFRPPGRSR